VIKINLLPLESFRQTAGGKLLVTIFFVVMVAVGLLMYFANVFYMTPKVEALQKEKANYTKTLNDLSSQAKAALEQTTLFVKEMVQVAAISELEERRRDQARLFMAIASQVNNQTTWLTSCSHDKGVLSIKGMATDHEAVASFLSRLEQLPLLKQVELQRAAGDTVINRVKLVTFEIKSSSILPDPTLLDQGLPDVNLPDGETIRKIVSAAAPDLAKALERNKENAKLL
jgi:Tfp pilus assembly protein PilN